MKEGNGFLSVPQSKSLLQALPTVITPKSQRSPTNRSPSGSQKKRVKIKAEDIELLNGSIKLVNIREKQLMNKLKNFNCKLNEPSKYYGRLIKDMEVRVVENKAAQEEAKKIFK
mmetsp:Transcript_24553/g.24147  ORF Transcript_24553/g.24147 Transcript_24553/m.24147 type:complete len:114 (+) Transcript_24553:2-343(+)